MAKEIVTPYGTFAIQREDKTKFITVYKSPEGNRHFELRNHRVKPGDFITTEHAKLSAAVGSPYKHIGCVRLGAYDLEGKLVTKANDRYDGDDAVKPDSTENQVTPRTASDVEFLMAENLREADIIIDALLRQMEDIPNKALEDRIIAWKAELGIIRNPTWRPKPDAKQTEDTGRFTRKQYRKAIDSLLDAMEQLEPDGRCCTCCGDTGHQAFECGFNPLVAMAICVGLAKDAREYHDKMHAEDKGDLKALNETNRLQADSEELHELVHFLAGFDSYMGCQVGPAKVKLPNP